jgi:hypothetical protein
VTFKPKPLEPSELTAALKDGMQDVPRTVARREPEPSPPPEPVPAPSYVPQAMVDEPPLRAAPPEDVPKRFTSFRLPVDLDEELRAMIYETRRSKQDLLISFVTEGIRKWRLDRLRK